MNIIGISEFPLILASLILPVGFIFGAIGSVIGGIFGSGKAKVAAAQSSAAQQLAKMKATMTQQMEYQAQESKKTLMFVGIGAAVLVVIMFVFMKK